MKQRHFTKLDDKSHLLAGGIAGCVAKSFVAPFDRVKILFQTKSPYVSQYSGNFLRFSKRQIGKITGVFGAIKAVYGEQGIAGLFRGHSMTLLRIFPYASVQFASYERYKQLLAIESHPNDQVRRFLSGAAAGVTAVTLTYPFDIFRTRLVYLTNKNGPKNSLLEIHRQLWNENFGLFQGYPATLLGIFFYAGSSFYVFETLKKHILSFNSSLFSNINEGHSTLRALPKFCCGVLAGLVGQTVAYPFDVVRRRMQLRNIAQPLSTYSSILGSFLRVWTQEGLRGFFVGLSINYLKVGPSTGISFLVYEFLKEKLYKHET